MNLKKHLIALVLIPVLPISLFVHAQTKPLTASDKTQIIKSILKQEDFKDSETWSAGNSENTVYLLVDNISSAQLPQITGVRFVLVTQKEVDEMARTGVEYYRFGDFEVRKAFVRAILIRKYRSVVGKHSNGSITEYRCRRFSGGWRAKGRAGAAYTAESH